MDWGLILKDDGTMGAYQIGVWKGLLECGVNIRVVSATSAALLNGAFIAHGQMTQALTFWSNPKDNPMIQLNRQLAACYANEWASMDAAAQKNQLKSMLSDANSEYFAAKEYLRSFFTDRTPQRGSTQLQMHTFQKETLVPRTRILDQSSPAQEGWLDDLLLGYFLPVFPSFVDESQLERSLLVMAEQSSLKDWIVLGFSPAVITRLKKRLPDAQIISLSPSEYLGLSLETNQTSILRNMELGYLDTLKKWNRVSGKTYFLDLSRDRSHWDRFEGQLGHPLSGEDGIKLGLLLGTDGSADRQERLIRLKELLSVTQYKDQAFPLSLLEITARAIQLPRLKRYTPNQMIQDLFKGINDLLSEHLATIKNPEFIVKALQQDPEDLTPQSPLNFLSSYVYFLSLRVHNTQALERLGQRFSPETILAITTLLYLGQKK